MSLDTPNFWWKQKQLSRFEVCFHLQWYYWNVCLCCLIQQLWCSRTRPQNHRDNKMVVEISPPLCPPQRFNLRGSLESSLTDTSGHNMFYVQQRSSLFYLVYWLVVVELCFVNVGLWTWSQHQFTFGSCCLMWRECKDLLTQLHAFPRCMRSNLQQFRI